MNDLGLHLVVLEVTGKCNLACKHCYGRGEESGDLLDISWALKNLAEAPPHYITVSGGEPLLLGKELFTIAQELKKVSRVLYLVTNGTLVGEFPSFWFKIFDEVQISLDGTEEIHDAIRGSGAFKKALNAARLLRPEVAVSFLCTVNNWNFNSLETLQEITKKYGVILKIERMSGYGAGGLRPIEDPENWKETLEKASKLNIITDDPLNFCFKGQPLPESRGNRVTGGCMAGIGSLAISPSLDVFPCVRLRVAAGNLKKETLRQIWLGSTLLKKFRDPKGLQGKCADCLYVAICRGCRADAWTRHGDIFAPDPLCWLNTKMAT